MTATNRATNAKTSATREDRKYRAPALERGLDIIEVLSKTDSPMNIRKICEQIQLSRQQIYRMMLVLEERGYIEKSFDSDTFALTPKLLTLGVERRTHTEFIEFCKPIMNTVAERSEQACHIAVRSGDQIVVIARSESFSAVNYMLRLGYRRPIHQSASGRTIFAFSAPALKEIVLNDLTKTATTKEVQQFKSECQEVQKLGFIMKESEHVDAVYDISVPLTQKGRAFAALTMPYIGKKHSRIEKEYCLKLLKDAATAISKAIEEGRVLPL